MTETETRTAAAEFATKWADRGYEKGDTAVFWIELLRKVLGVENPEEYIQFEQQVQLGHTSFIDARIPAVKVLIEQKGMDIDLTHKQRQSDGAQLTPMEQAQRYVVGLRLSEHPRFIVVCNFKLFQIYDTEERQLETLELSSLAHEVYRLNFLVDTEAAAHIKHEEEISFKAGEIVGQLYDGIRTMYHNPDAPDSLLSLNQLCVRLVFCLYAEDAGLFGVKGQFHDYLAQFDTRHTREALINLFKLLDTEYSKRDPYMEDSLKAFPYVNGGLFHKDIEVPNFTDDLRKLLLEKASDEFDWSAISPTIFGAVFESTLNPDTRRKGGMHYTSIANIHKVIDPLFLNGIKDDLNTVMQLGDPVRRKEALERWQYQLAQLSFLDPACGSGNFLTETYTSLRKLENRAIKELQRLGVNTEVRVSIMQFYGIEINDFAAVVAKTALWIAEHQMLKQTESLLQTSLSFLPLKTYVNITEGDALMLDWEQLRARPFEYIMGNPPFSGYSIMSKQQKMALLAAMPGVRCAGSLDLVAGWFYKAAMYMRDKSTRSAFVSTNSIVQGQQVGILWKPIMENLGVHIDFAYRTFKWSSEAYQVAAVCCVIVGFSAATEHTPKLLFDEAGEKHEVEHINGYLTTGPNVFIMRENKSLSDAKFCCKGTMPLDGGNLLLSQDERDELVLAEPAAERWIKKFAMGQEFLHAVPRYCLWLEHVTPRELSAMPRVMSRSKACHDMRIISPSPGTRKLADTPWLMRETYNPANYLAIPKTTSESRNYIPMDFLDDNTVAGDSLFCIENASKYDFGILTSDVHMAWMRVVGGRLETRYSYSATVVYNSFIWPETTAEQEAAITDTAQGILDARARYPGNCLADLYSETLMPPELRRAHRANDALVRSIYGYRRDTPEEDIVADLMRRYAEKKEPTTITNNNNNQQQQPTRGPEKGPFFKEK